MEGQEGRYNEETWPWESRQQSDSQTKNTARWGDRTQCSRQNPLLWTRWTRGGVRFRAARLFLKVFRGWTAGWGLGEHRVRGVVGYGCKQIITNHWSSSFSAARLSAHPPCRGDTQTPVLLTPHAFRHHQQDDGGSVTANWLSVTAMLFKEQSGT